MGEKHGKNMGEIGECVCVCLSCIGGWVSTCARSIPCKRVQVAPESRAHPLQWTSCAVRRCAPLNARVRSRRAVSICARRCSEGMGSVLSCLNCPPPENSPGSSPCSWGIGPQWSQGSCHHWPNSRGSSQGSCPHWPSSKGSPQWPLCTQRGSVLVRVL